MEDTVKWTCSFREWLYKIIMRKNTLTKCKAISMKRA